MVERARKSAWEYFTLDACEEPLPIQTKLILESIEIYSSAQPAYYAREDNEVSPF